MMKTVAYEALEQVSSKKENIQVGFCKTGLFPWNKIQPDHRKLTAGTIYKKTFVHDQVFPFPPGSSGPLDTAPTATTPPPAVTAPTQAAAPDATDPGPAAADATDHVPAAPLYAPALGSDIDPEADVIADYADLPGSSSSAAPPAVSSVDMDREASTTSTATLPTTTNTVDFLLADQRQMSFDKKQKSLKKFEATLLLDEDKVEMFEELYAKANFDVPHAEYQ